MFTFPESSPVLLSSRHLFWPWSKVPVSSKHLITWQAIPVSTSESLPSFVSSHLPKQEKQAVWFLFHSVSKSWVAPRSRSMGSSIYCFSQNLSKYTLDFIVHNEIVSVPISMSLLSTVTACCKVPGQGSDWLQKKFTVDSFAFSSNVTFVANNAAKSSTTLG